MFTKILIADDSALARTITRQCLEIAGYGAATFFEAKNGIEALDLAKDQKIELMVIDLNMPEMDGKSLLKRVKSSPKLFELPVLVVTSSRTEQKEIDLRNLGAFAVLNKPISPAIIASTLEIITSNQGLTNA